MKRIITVLVTLALFSLGNIEAFSQIEKGTRFINANLTGIEFGKWDIKPKDAEESMEITQFGLNLSGGQFVTDNLALKVSLGFLSAGLASGGDDMGTLKAFTGMAGVRYQLESGLFLGGGLGIGNLTLEPEEMGEITLKSTMFGLEAGYAFFLSERISIEPAITYLTSLSSEVEMGGGSDDYYSWKWYYDDYYNNDKLEFELTQIGFSLGITIFL